jgi:hypothetical protein
MLRSVTLELWQVENFGFKNKYKMTKNSSRFVDFQKTTHTFIDILFYLPENYLIYKIFFKHAKGVYAIH